jgi:hypothetical protein
MDNQEADRIDSSSVQVHQTQPEIIQQDNSSCVPSPSSNNEISRPKLQLSVSDWLNVLQMIALICAGIWTIFIFTRFEARDKQIARQLADVSLQKSAFEIEQINSKRLLSRQSVNIEEIKSESSDKQNRFRVIYTYSITNRSSKKIEISSANIRVFFKEGFDAPNSRVDEIPSLAELDNLKKWEKILSKGYVIEGKWKPDTKAITLDREEIFAEKGGSITSELESGETAYGSLALIIKARKNNFIGFRLEAFVNDDGTRAERNWQLTQELPLVQGEFSGGSEVQEDNEKK